MSGFPVSGGLAKHIKVLLILRSNVIKFLWVIKRVRSFDEFRHKPSLAFCFPVQIWKTASLAQGFNARFVRGRSELDTRSSQTKDSKNFICQFPCLAFSILGKSMGVQHTMLPDGQPKNYSIRCACIAVWPKRK